MKEPVLKSQYVGMSYLMMQVLCLVECISKCGSERAAGCLLRPADLTFFFQTLRV